MHEIKSRDQHRARGGLRRVDVVRRLCAADCVKWAKKKVRSSEPHTKVADATLG